MDKSSIKYAKDGDASLLVLSVPEEISASHSVVSCYAVPVLSRRNGMMLMVPFTVLDQEKLIDELQHDGDGLLGPSKSFVSELASEDDEGTLTLLGIQCRYLVVDFNDDVLQFLHEYDPATDEEGSIVPFDDEHPSAIPVYTDLPQHVVEWASANAPGRVHFYSAQEDPETPTLKASAPHAPKKSQAKKISNAALAEMVTQLSAQVQLLASQSRPDFGRTSKPAPKPSTLLPSAALANGPDNGGTLAGPRLPGVSETLGFDRPYGTPVMDAVHKAATMIGPPPKVRSAIPQPSGPAPQVHIPGEEPVDWRSPGVPVDPMLQALSQQSSALTTLVAHLASSSDLFTDLTASGSTGASSAMRGAQRREKLQGELAQGSSQFFLQVMQQMHRKMHPARQTPQNEAELAASSLSMLSYLERFGGYRGNREGGLLMWILAHAIDNLIVGDVAKAKEHLALLIVSVEQSNLDGGDWGVAFLMSLVGDPPIQIFQDRQASVIGQQRPFAALAPPLWCTTVLAYLKELEVMQNRKGETTAKPKAASPKKEDTTDSPSPKRRPRYPKKPKSAPEGAS